MEDEDIIEIADRECGEFDPPPTMYHFSDKGRNLITEGGLAARECPTSINPLGDGVYMYGYNAQIIHQASLGDLWIVDVSGLEDELQPDFELAGAWYHPGPINAERLRRA